MSHLSYSTYPGYGEHAEKELRYSQAVKIGDLVYLSGQGGWSQELPLRYPSTQEEQIDQAWRNIVTALKEAGAAPEHIFKIASFHRPMSTSAMTAMTRNMERLLPNRRPIWTSIEVIRLAFDDMAVEIEVTAHVPPSFQA